MLITAINHEMRHWMKPNADSMMLPVGNFRNFCWIHKIVDFHRKNSDNLFTSCYCCAIFSMSNTWSLLLVAFTVCERTEHTQHTHNIKNISLQKALSSDKCSFGGGGRKIMWSDQGLTMRTLAALELTLLLIFLKDVDCCPEVRERENY